MILIIAVMSVSLLLVSCGSGGDRDGAETTYVGQYIPPDREILTKVDVLEINQALSYDYDESTGEYSLMSNFVSGKNTLVFARTTKSFEESGEEIRLKLTSKNGVACEYGQYAPLSDEYCAAFLIPAKDIEKSGNYTFSLRADGYEIAKRTEYLAETKELNVLFVPLKARIARFADAPDDYSDLLSHVSAAYPISTDKLIAHVGRTADLSGSSYDLSTSDGLYNVWKYLSDQASDKYDLVIGLVNGNMGEEMQYAAYSCGYPAVIINVNSHNYSAVISHELAHFWQVGDEYDGGVFNPDVNGAPAGYKGVSFYDRNEALVSENNNITKASDYGYAVSGSAVSEALIPCNTSEITLYGTKASFMGSLEASTWDYWITPAVWNQLYEALAVHEFDITAGKDSGIFKNDRGETVLYCGQCMNHSLLAADNLYGYCAHCFSLTQMAADGSFTVNCRSCGVTSQNVPTFVMCPYENCKAGHRIHLEDSESESASLIEGKYSSKTISLSKDPTVNVLRVSGVITLTEEGYEFTVGKTRRAVDHIDNVTTNATEGVCAFAITDIDGFIINTVYLELDFTLLTNPISKVESLPISFNIRLPKNGMNLVFFESVFDENGYCGLKYGGYTRNISSITKER